MKRYIGVFLIALGIVLLVVAGLTGLSHFNLFLLLPYSIIIIGLCLHVWQQKRQSKY